MIHAFERMRMKSQNWLESVPKPPALSREPNEHKTQKKYIETGKKLVISGQQMATNVKSIKKTIQFYNVMLFVFVPQKNTNVCALFLFIRICYFSSCCFGLLASCFSLHIRLTQFY